MFMKLAKKILYTILLTAAVFGSIAFFFWIMYKTQPYGSFACVVSFVGFICWKIVDLSVEDKP